MKNKVKTTELQYRVVREDDNFIYYAPPYSSCVGFVASKNAYFKIVEKKQMEWISVKNAPPRKDIPILVFCKHSQFPDSVKWEEDGTYGEPAFFDTEKEYDTKEKDILFWMPIPELPKEG